MTVFILVIRVSLECKYVYYTIMKHDYILIKRDRFILYTLFARAYLIIPL